MVRKLDRRGFAVQSKEGKETMSGDSEIKGLTDVIKEEVTKLRDEAATVKNNLHATLGEAHGVIDYVKTMEVELRKAVGDLQAALGQHSNLPPKDNSQ
jgi:hypothetical protein